METARNPWARAQRRALIRGCVAAFVSTGIALLSHLMAGGALPALPGLILPLFLATGVCALLAGVRVPAVRLLVSVGASQLLFHHLFMLGATAPTGAGHAHHHTAAAAPEPSAWMLLAHVAAAVLTALALRHGELILARIGASLRRLAWRFLRPVTPGPARPTAAPARLVDERAWVPVARLLVRASVVRRGPPSALAVLTS